MRDDFHSQVWAENHRQISDAIHKLGRSVIAAFDALHAQQFDAPWHARPAKRNKTAYKRTA